MAGVGPVPPEAEIDSHRPLHGEDVPADMTLVEKLDYAMTSWDDDALCIVAGHPTVFTRAAARVASSILTSRADTTNPNNPAWTAHPG